MSESAAAAAKRKASSSSSDDDDDSDEADDSDEDVTPDRKVPKNEKVARSNNEKKKAKTTENTPPPPPMLARPKRPLSAYNFFFREERSKILAEREEKAKRGGSTKKATKDNTKQGNSNSRQQKHQPGGGDLFSMLGKTIATRWKAVTVEGKAKYKQLAEQDLERYRQERDAYQFGAVRQPGRTTTGETAGDHDDDHGNATGATAAAAQNNDNDWRSTTAVPASVAAAAAAAASSFQASKTAAANSILAQAAAAAAAATGFPQDHYHHHPATASARLMMSDPARISALLLRRTMMNQQQQQTTLMEAALNNNREAVGNSAHQQRIIGGGSLPFDSSNPPIPTSVDSSQYETTAWLLEALNRQQHQGGSHGSLALSSHELAGGGFGFDHALGHRLAGVTGRAARLAPEEESLNRGRRGQLGSLSMGSRGGLLDFHSTGSSSTTLEQALLQLHDSNNSAFPNSNLLRTLDRSRGGGGGGGGAPQGLDGGSAADSGAMFDASLMDSLIRGQLAAATESADVTAALSGRQQAIDHAESTPQSFLRQNRSPALPRQREPLSIQQRLASLSDETHQQDTPSTGSSIVQLTNQSPFLALSSASASCNPTTDELFLRRLEEGQRFRIALQPDQGGAAAVLRQRLLLQQQLEQQQQQHAQQQPNMSDPGLLDLQRALARQRQANEMRQAEEETLILPQNRIQLSTAYNPLILQVALQQQQEGNSQLQHLLDYGWPSSSLGERKRPSS
jgi:HMG (high mobility group) box